MVRCLPLTLVTFLVALPPLAAHDIKVLASHLTTAKIGEKTTIYLSWGHALPVDDLVDAKTIERYELVGPHGRTAMPLKSADQSLQANVVELAEAGVYQAVIVRKPTVLTYVFDEEGNRVMKRGPKSAIKEGKIDVSRRSQQFGKAIMLSNVTGKSPPIQTLGLPLEIVPTSSPTDWRVGELPIQVLFQGKPLAGEHVFATYVGYRPADAWAFATATDRQGQAVIRVSQPGTWVLKVNVRRPATGAALKDYDEESYTGTVALEVRP